MGPGKTDVESPSPGGHAGAIRAARPAVHHRQRAVVEPADAARDQSASLHSLTRQPQEQESPRHAADLLLRRPVQVRSDRHGSSPPSRCPSRATQSAAPGSPPSADIVGFWRLQGSACTSIAGQLDGACLADAGERRMWIGPKTCSWRSSIKPSRAISSVAPNELASTERPTPGAGSAGRY